MGGDSKGKKDILLLLGIVVRNKMIFYFENGKIY